MKRCHILPFLALFIGTSAHALDENEAELWQQDILAYQSQLKQRHIDVFHNIEEEAFDDAVEALIDNLDELNRDQVLTQLMQLSHRIGDGHTSIPLWNQDLHYFPFAVNIFSGKAYVTHTNSEHSQLLGHQIVSINDVPVADILSQLKNTAPFIENAQSANIRAAQYLPRYEVLHGLGILNSQDQVVFQFHDGSIQYPYRLSAQSEIELGESLSFRQNQRFEKNVVANDNFWLGSHNGGETAYVYFRRYIASNEMFEFAPQALAYLQAHQSRQLIIDLRENYGGDFFAGLILAQHLVLADSIDWRHGVYVLTDAGTFSAAMSNAAQFSQILNAKRVGQATGAQPSGYQDMGQFTLPNSELIVTYSKRFYRFSDTMPTALFPDVGIETKLEHYQQQQDPVMAWVLNDIQRQTQDKNE